VASAAPGRRRPLGPREASVLALLGLLAAGCAAAPQVIPIRIAARQAPPPVPLEPTAGYEPMVQAAAAVLQADLRLPLPAEFAVFVYATRAGYEAGLVRTGGLSAERARDVAAYAVGLGQHRQLLLNDEALRQTPLRARLSLVAHELTHLAQYELSGGRRGRSEQWLREGMADWVAARVLERLGESTLAREREAALRALARHRRTIDEDPFELVDLGRPLGWETRHLRAGGRLIYWLAFLLADDLIGRHGFDRLLAYFRAFADSNDRFGHFERAFGRRVDEFEREALPRIRAEVAAAAARLLGPSPAPAASPR
jgi:hypothetical protein